MHSRCTHTGIRSMGSSLGLHRSARVAQSALLAVRATGHRRAWEIISGTTASSVKPLQPWRISKHFLHQRPAPLPPPSSDRRTFLLALFALDCMRHWSCGDR
eukprot:15457202-Alexandrium_andersonii.AAC.1